MKVLSMFDWSPDGMVLSKLGRSGDPGQRRARAPGHALQHRGAGARHHQDVDGRRLLVAMPMDKVFILVCADIVWTIGGAGTPNDVGFTNGVADPGKNDGLWQSYAKALVAPEDDVKADAAQRERDAARPRSAPPSTPMPRAAKRRRVAQGVL